MTELKLPELGEGIEEADVIKILVSVGDSVEAGQPLMEIETEKATLEVPADTSGVVTGLPVKEGDTIKVGQVIAVVESDGARQAAPEGPTEEEATTEPEPAEEPEEAAPAEEPAEAEAEPEERQTAEERAAPKAEEDERPAEEPARKEAPGPAAAPAPETSAGPEAVFASPALRKFAREIGVDLTHVQGSGPGGRITEEDVKLAARERPSAPPAAHSPDGGRAAPDLRPLPDFSQWGPVTREPVSRLRRTVARNMTQSWTEIPHVHLQHHADITAMEELRQRYKDRARRAGGNLTISVMMLRVVASALRAHPRVNSSYDPENQELIMKDYVHIGVAVDTDRGLVVPKIENVDEKNIIELSVELNEIAERARTNDLTLEEMRGSTFTITNLGSLGTGYFDPIINWPEVAVLGLGRAEQRAVWDEQRREFAPKLIMPLSFAHDHRVLDGADGARFMSWIVEAIRNPLLMALEG